MIKVGVLGVGGISGCHIPAWQKIPEVRLVALCDIRPQQTEKYKDSGMHIYTDFEDMVANEELDILDICLPTYLHVEYSIKAMNMGMNVLCEKPISLNIEDVDRVYAAAKKNNVKFMVAHVLRFWNEYVYLKNIYDNKTYGNFLCGSVKRLGNTPKWSWDNWMTDPDRSGLVPFDLHIHDLDFIVYAFGLPSDFKTFRSKGKNEDSIHAVYLFDNGSYISADSAWYNNDYPFTTGYRFQFERAVVEFDGKTISIYESNGNISTVGSDVTGDSCINLPPTNAYFDEIKYFTDCVIKDKPADIIKPEELKLVLTALKSF